MNIHRLIQTGPYYLLGSLSQLRHIFLIGRFAFRKCYSDIPVQNPVTDAIGFAAYHPSVPATKLEYLQKLLLQQPYTPNEDSRLLKVAVIGCPNAGKSSLVNMLVKWRVCAVAGKAHTTRSKQMAALMQDNVQVVFTDLPGLVNSSQAWKFNLDKAFMRDPHAAIFDSDLILVVVDATHKRSKEELHPEIVRALHFFENKETVLVLNKIDKTRNNPTRLLEVTRRLTRGTVNGRQSHTDAYMARFLRRQRLSLSTTCTRLLPPAEVIARHLPSACHAEATTFLTRLSQLRQRLSEASSRLVTSSAGGGGLSQFLLGEKPTTAAAVCQVHGEVDDSSVRGRGESTGEPPWEEERGLSLLPAAESGERIVTDADIDCIDAYFDKYGPDRHPDEKEDDVPQPGGDSRPFDKDDDAYLTTLTEILEEQLMLKSATPEEVALRRQRWLDVSLRVKGVRDWPGFSEVFMVSSATGDGVDRLRAYLVSKAVPNRRWLLSPLLVTDQEPSELVRMCVWAHCLQRLRQEVPYSLRIVVDDCQRAAVYITGEEGDDRVFVHARLQCRSERHLRQVLGIGGSTIRELAAAVKLELMNMFRANTVVKLTAEMMTVRPTVMRKLRRAKDFAEVFPERQQETI